MKFFKGLLIVAAAGQLAIPAYLIHRQETTLRDGRAYKFRTAPVDPYDAFRGRYVALRYEQDHAPWPGTNQVLRQQRAYARIEEGVDGYAVVREVTPGPPVTGDFFKIQANYAGWGTNAGTVYFTMPFDRYYMEETKAPKAEQVYRDNNRRGQTNGNTYAVIRIRNGHAALENLFVASKPITELVGAKLPPAQ